MDLPDPKIPKPMNLKDNAHMRNLLDGFWADHMYNKFMMENNVEAYVDLIDIELRNLNPLYRRFIKFLTQKQGELTTHEFFVLNNKLFAEANGSNMTMEQVFLWSFIERTKDMDLKMKTPRKATRLAGMILSA